jgi:formylglycine-generating enzyme required for sulfatase activity/fibronectin type 3 domain-containing protein
MVLVLNIRSIFMKNSLKSFEAMRNIAIIAITAIIWLTFASCTEEDSGLPALTGSVTITGTAQAGETLTANTSSLGGTGTISYQWKRGITPVGNNNSTYKVLADDVGSTITVTVTRSGNSGNITSSPTVVITNPSLPALTGIITITGTAQVGQTLTANTGSLGGSGTITYQWKRGSTVIGTNISTYTVQTADIGSTITVTVTRTGFSGSIVSNATATVTNPPQATEGLAFELIKGNTEYSISLGTAIASGTIIIPATYNGKPVTTIANDAFANCSNMTSIIIPNSITDIGSGAFSGCTGLVRVTFLSVIVADNFSTTAQFPGVLRAKYLDEGIGTYSRANGTTNTWTGAPTVYVTEATSNSITLGWNVISGATGYRVYRSASADGVFTEIGTPSTISFVDTGLTAGTTYFYRVAANYSEGMSPRSNVFTTTIPSIPTGITAVTASSSSITIRWSSVQGATGYRVFRSTSAAGTFTQVGTPTTTSFTNIELTANTTYFYRVAAANSNGVGEQSSAVSATTLPLITINTQPAATTSVIAGNINGSLNVSASVTQGGGPLSYQWYTNTTASNSGGTVINGATSSSYTIPTSLAGGTYYYFVEVRATGGALSVRSNVAMVNVVLPVITINTQPAATTNVNFGSVSGSLSVSASVTGGATLSYQWYSNTTANDSGGTVINGATGSSYTIPASLVRGSYYYFVEVRATGGAVSVRSNVAIVGVRGSPIKSSTGIDLIDIPSGTFQMNGTDSGGTGRPVTLTKGFYMGKYEVTQEQYQAVTGVNPSYFPSDPASGEIQGRRPVECVTWYDAIEFCNKLSEQESLTKAYTITGRTPAVGYPITSASVTVNWEANGYRLPTEAEWEYACRAGTTTAYNTGNTISDNTGWYQSNSNGRTHEVGLKSQNAWGLYDMHGNVREWCWDLYGTYTSGAQTDPTGTAYGSARVVRDGSWNHSGEILRSAFRGSVIPDLGLNYIGFRVVRP